MKFFLSVAVLIGGVLSSNASQAVITSGPQNLTINAGSTADFVVTATNAKTYQWRFQGVNIAGATKSTYKIDDTGTNQAGIYSVVVRGSTGTNITNSATLNVIQGTIVNFQVSGFATGPSNILVELFDHDKPATVENFVHYITSGAYTNMFFDRLIPGFVLQGGGWYAVDQTNTIPPPQVGDIYQTYVEDFQVNNPPLPEQVDSEFYVGPKISNLKGTIAMALPAGNVDGAANDFYFNLVDNTNLDIFTNNEGPFTVFGRVLSGTNVLQYFNNPKAFSQPPFTKYPTNNIFTNGIYDEIYLNSNYTDFLDLPVNYHGTNVPANDNLFFVNFSFPDPNAQPAVDTTPPTAAITFPPPNLILTNGIPVTIRGTAEDDVGLARVFCSLSDIFGAGGTNATGTTNWSAFFGILPPGAYKILVTPQDGAGNLGDLVIQDMTISAVIINGVGTVSATDTNGDVFSDAVGATFLYGTDYMLSAQPGSGQLFVGWSGGSNLSINPDITIEMAYNLAVTANFLPNTIPGAATFTFPAVGEAGVTYGTFSIQGSNNPLADTPLTLKCQLFTADNQLSVGQARQTTATTNWSFPFTNLALGRYIVQVIVQDAAGQTTLITNDLIVSAVFTNGVGSVSATNLSTGAVFSDAIGANLIVGTPYALGAQPGPGQLFVDWTAGTNVTINPNINIQVSSNLLVTANFISNALPGGISFTYPALGGNTTNGTFSIQGVINGLTNTPISLQCRLFSYTNALPASTTRLTSATTNWSFSFTNLALGHYFVQVIARDTTGQATLITNDFTAGLPMTVLTNGNGRGTIATDYNGKFLVQGQKYSMTATAAAGSIFDTWSDGVNYTNSRIVSFIMQPGLVLTATFLSNDIPGTIAFTYPPASPAAGSKLTIQTFNLTGTISPTVTNPVVSYQLFYGSNSMTPPGSTNVTVTPSRVKPTWSAGLTNLAPGYYTVVATVTDIKGRSSLVSESFQVMAQLILQVNPPGSGSISSNWTTGEFVSVGVPCKLTAKTNGGYVFAYWSNSVLAVNNPLTFTVTTNETISANFASNYFYNVAGTYNGLFFPTGPGSVISATNSGYYSLSVSSNAAINMALSFPALKLTSTGAFPLYDPLGYATAGFFWKGLDGKYVTNYVNLDLTNGTYSIAGTVTNAEFSSTLNGFRAVSNLTANSLVLPGTNVLSIPGDQSGTNNQPGGDGYGAFTLGSKGAISVIGFLADNTSFSQNLQISTSGTNAVWPFYASLNSGKGIILGFITNTSPTNFEGGILWTKPAKTGSYYTNAFLAFTNASSAPYLPPVNGTHYQIAFGGSSLTNGLTNTFTVSATGLLTVDPGQTNKLILSFTPKSGVLTGSFSYPTAKIVHNLYGAFTSPALGGSGYFLDTNSQTGWFQITAIVTASGASAADAAGGVINIIPPESGVENNITPQSGVVTTSRQAPEIP